MNLKGVAERIRRGDVQYALGRFKTVRLAYGGARRLLDPPRLRSNGVRATLFPDVDVGQIVRTVRKEAVFIGLNLPTETVVDYHYDLGGFNFVYASFYITITN